MEYSVANTINTKRKLRKKTNKQTNKCKVAGAVLDVAKPYSSKHMHPRYPSVMLWLCYVKTKLTFNLETAK